MLLPEGSVPNEIPLRPRLRSGRGTGFLLRSPATPSSGSEHDFVPDLALRQNPVLNRDLTPLPRCCRGIGRRRLAAIGVGSEFRTMLPPEGAMPNEIPLRPRLRSGRGTGFLLRSPATPSSGSEHDFVPDLALRQNPVLNRDLTPLPRCCRGIGRRRLAAIGVGSEFRTMLPPEGAMPNEIPLRPRLRSGRGTLVSGHPVIGVRARFRTRPRPPARPSS